MKKHAAYYLEDLTRLAEISRKELLQWQSEQPYYQPLKYLLAKKNEMLGMPNDDAKYSAASYFIGDYNEGDRELPLQEDVSRSEQIEVISTQHNDDSIYVDTVDDDFVIDSVPANALMSTMSEEHKDSSELSSILEGYDEDRVEEVGVNEPDVVVGFSEVSSSEESVSGLSEPGSDLEREADAEEKELLDEAPLEIKIENSTPLPVDNTVELDSKDSSGGADLADEDIDDEDLSEDDDEMSDSDHVAGDIAEEGVTESDVSRVVGKSEFLTWLVAKEGKQPKKVKAAKKKKKKKKGKKEQEAIRHAEKSTYKDNTVVSETLARILAQQGHTDEAIEMYEQLSLLISEKSDYFAAKIQELKKS